MQKKEYYYRAKSISGQQSISDLSESEDNIGQIERRSSIDSRQESLEQKEASLDVMKEERQRNLRSQSLTKTSLAKSRSRAYSDFGRGTWSIVI